MDVRIDAVHKRFGAVEALRGVDLAVDSGEFFAILGPSGAGKTTLLRIIAGIAAADSGTVRLDGRDVGDIPLRARDTAMVFQTFALYPHLSTFENLAYPLREARVRGSEIRRRVGEVAEMLRLTHALARRPGTLSGGEQQRCAIGRALIRRPRLLLLDEPLTNLDAKLRHDTRAEFKRLHRELGSTTILYATPDQLEALSMGSRVAVLREGRVVQVATPQALYAAPGDTFVAALVGDPTINLIEGRVAGPDRIELPFTAIDASAWRGTLAALPTGAPIQVGVRPQGVAPVARSTAGRFPARIHLTEPLGDVTILDIVAGGDTGAGTGLRMVLPQEQAFRIDRDAVLDCVIDPAQVCLFAHPTGAALGRDA